MSKASKDIRKKERKEKMRLYLQKAKKTAPFVLIFLYLILIYGFIEKKSNLIQCTQIKVNLKDSTKNHFISDTDIKKILKTKHFNIIGYPFRKINSLAIEELIKKHPSIENANVYSNIAGVLNINIKQREPIIRIIDNSNKSYYIDNNGFTMPLSENYTAHVPIISGDIPPKKLIQNIEKDSLLKQIYQLAKNLNQQKEWKAMINEIIISPIEGFILLPQIGSQKIILGKEPNFNKDFKILSAFYKKALPQVGWDKYKSIDLRYDKQIVCKK